MAIRRKTWLGVGIVALASTALTPLARAEIVSQPNGPSVATTRAGSPLPATGRTAPDFMRLAGGEGGEGGEAGGGVPETYALPSTDANAYKYDAKPEIAAYAKGVYASYQASIAEAKKLDAAIDAMLANPTDATLAAARKAWVAARPAYLLTEAFRFYDGPIEELEGQINAWPMDEAFIDYVDGKASAGIINDAAITISIGEIDARDQKTDEDDVTTGWHAIEFLLWGQDLNADGPGNRPVSDYLAGKGNNDRRRLYLKLVGTQLVADLEKTAAAWAPGEGGNYAAKFIAMPVREAIGRIVNGMAVLAGSELMSERLAVGLDSGDQEDEHSCFSDTTHQDFVYDVKGIENVWKGTYPGGSGPGIEALVAKQDPALAAEVSALLADATAKVAALGDPWDKVLASPEGSPGREIGEEAVQALSKLGEGFKKVGEKLGVVVQNFPPAEQWTW